MTSQVVTSMTLLGFHVTDGDPYDVTGSDVTIGDHYTFFAKHN